MRNIKPFLIIYFFFTVYYSFGQASCEVKENFGNIFQFNNNGSVYITFAIFNVQNNQLIIDVIKNLKTDTITKENLPEIAKNKGKSFITLPAESTEAKAALQNAKTIFIPAVKENVKESVCWEDVIDDAQKKGNMTIQKADNNTIRVIIGDAENVLKDFKIIFSENYGIVRVKENGKYSFEQKTGDCLVTIGMNCKRYDFATDFEYGGQALVGEKQYGGTIEYYYINTSGKRVSENTYTEVIPNYAKCSIYSLSKLKLKDGREVLSENGQEKFYWKMYDKITFIGGYEGDRFFSIKLKKKTGLLKINSNICYPTQINPTLLDEIDTLYHVPITAYVGKGWVSVKTENGWNIIDQNDIRLEFDSTKLILKGKYADPIRVQKSDQFKNYNLIQSGKKVGLIGKYTADIIFEPIFDEIGIFDPETKLAKVRIGNLWGLINETGNMILPVEYDEIGVFDKKKHSKVKRKGLFGFVHSDGSIALNMIYDKIQDFKSPDVAIIEKSGKKGCINTDKKILFTPRYDEIAPFSENGMAIVKIGDKYGVISPQTPEKEFIEPKYQEVIDLKNGNFFFKFLSRKGWLEYGIIKRDKSEVKIMGGKAFYHESLVKTNVDYNAKCIFIRINPYYSSEHSRVIDFEGGSIYTGPIYNQDFSANYYAGYYYDLYAGITVLRIKIHISSYLRKYIILKDGKLLSPGYDDLETKTYLDHNLIKVKLSNRIGCIDLSGKEIIPIRYKEIGIFSSSAYAFVQDSTNNWAVFSKTGKQITGFDYTKYGSFPSEMVNVNCKSGGIGYLSFQKDAVQPVITCKYYSGDEFKDGYAVVQESSDPYMQGIINTSDLIVVPFIFSIRRKEDNSFEATRRDGKTFLLRKSARKDLKRLECVSGDCTLYEQLSKAFFEKRN